MDEVRIRTWFEEYLSVLADRGRGGSDDLVALMEYYGVPLIVTTDDATRALSTADDVQDFARQQIAGMRAAGYDRTATIHAEVTALNATSVLYRGAFERRRADGSVIGRLAVTYLITDGPGGLRTSALAIHTP